MDITPVLEFVAYGTGGLCLLSMILLVLAVKFRDHWDGWA